MSSTPLIRLGPAIPPFVVTLNTLARLAVKVAHCGRSFAGAMVWPPKYNGSANPARFHNDCDY